MTDADNTAGDVAVVAGITLTLTLPDGRSASAVTVGPSLLTRWPRS